jgi:hypothetical protein
MRVRCADQIAFAWFTRLLSVAASDYVWMAAR